MESSRLRTAHGGMSLWKCAKSAVSFRFHGTPIRSMSRKDHRRSTTEQGLWVLATW